MFGHVNRNSALKKEGAQDELAKENMDVVV